MQKLNLLLKDQVYLEKIVKKLVKKGLKKDKSKIIPSKNNPKSQDNNAMKNTNSKAKKQK